MVEQATPFIAPRALQAIRTRNPDTADRFVERLNGEIASWCAAHDLTVVRALSGGALSAVCEVRTRSGARAVLKVPTEPAVAAFEAATYTAWEATGRPSTWPKVLNVDTDVGVLLVEFLDGDCAHRLSDVWAGCEHGVTAQLATIAESVPVPGTPNAGGLFAGLLDAVDVHLGAQKLVPGWRAAARPLFGALQRVDAQPAVACHGDLWAGNVMVSPERVSVFDPAPVSTGVEFDIARVAADGWHGPGAEERAELLCDAITCDQSLVADLMVVFAFAQLATFLRHGWDPAPIRAGVLDVAAARALVVEDPAAQPPAEQVPGVVE